MSTTNGFGRGKQALAVLMLALCASGVQAQTCPAGNPVVAPDARYALSEPVTGQSVVEDLDTHLMWKRCPEGLSGVSCATGSIAGLDWSNALGAATTANTNVYAGYSDWRLPNIIELQSLVEFGCYSPSINGTQFPATGTGYYWWSSTTYALFASYAWYVDFNNGSLDTYGKNGNLQVRLVRGGQWLDLFKDGFEDAAQRRSSTNDVGLMGLRVDESALHN